MSERVLITGGAGFIGSHLSRALLESGYEVRVLDNLSPQVHGGTVAVPRYLPSDVEFLFGSVLDERVLEYALRGCEWVFHMAAETGVGQSMYEAGAHAAVNVVGTANLWDAMGRSRTQVRGVVLASSRAVYGEGAAVCGNCGETSRQARTPESLADGEWSPRCHSCGGPTRAVPTNEHTRREPTSVYGLTKATQEDLCHSLGRNLGISTIALRFFNVYGSHQSLKNPYTGLLATLLARARLGKELHVYEDGAQLRDFVHVHDVVSACMLTLEAERLDGESINVGTGDAISVLELTKMLVAVATPDTGVPIRVTKEYRLGDIRDCYADIRKARELLKFSPRVSLRNGLREFVEWAGGESIRDLSDQAAAELGASGFLGRACGG